MNNIEVKENQLYVDYLGNFKIVVCKSIGDSINEQFVTYKPLFEGAIPVTVKLEDFVRELTEDERKMSVTGQDTFHKPLSTIKLSESNIKSFTTKVLEQELLQREDSNFFGMSESNVIDDYYAVGRMDKTYLAKGEVNEQFRAVYISDDFEKVRNFYENHYDSRLIICRVTTTIIG